MSHNREFEIAFVGLKSGLHVFEYRVEDKFFTAYGHQDFTNCNANIKLSLDKKNGFMQLKFDIDGTVDIQCDRCGNPLTKLLWDEFNIVVKMVEEPDLMNHQEEDPDVFYIGKGESHLLIADWIYEFINLCLPIQNMCNPDEYGGTLCNKIVLEQLKKMEEQVNNGNNPLWKGLNQIKGLE